MRYLLASMIFCFGFVAGYSEETAEKPSSEVAVQEENDESQKEVAVETDSQTSTDKGCGCGGGK